MKTRNLITALAAVVLITAGTAMAQPGGMQGRGMGGGVEMEQGRGMVLQRFLPMLHRLDLTDEQMEQVREIVEEARASIEAIQGTDDHQGMREQFRDMFTSSSITVTEVEAVLNARLEDMEQVNSVIAEAIVELHGVLTAEQLEAIADFDPGEMGIHNSGHEEHASMMHGGASHSIHPPR